MKGKRFYQRENNKAPGVIHTRAGDLRGQTVQAHFKTKQERKNGEGTRNRPPLFMLPARNSTPEIHVGSANPRSLAPELIPKEQTKKDGYRQIIRDERGRVPLPVQEHVPLRAEDDDHGPGETPPGRVRHELAVPGQVLGVDALGFQTLAESDAGDADPEPVEHSGDGAHIGEPGEDGVGGLGDGEVGEAGEKGGKQQGVNGSSFGVGAGEDFGSLTVHGETVQSAGRGV